MLPSAGPPPESTVVYPASSSRCICAFSSGPVFTCLCASMKPGIADMPFASIVWPLFAAGAPAATDTILPPRTTIEPLSITVPLPTTMWAFVIVRSCADERRSNDRRNRQSDRYQQRRFHSSPVIA